MDDRALRLEMVRMITGFWVSRAVHVAAKLGLADHLAKGPRSVADLARETGTNERALFRLLRALASVGVFRGRPDGSFETTPLAATLESGPEGLRSFAVMAGDHLYEGWADLFFSIATGGAAYEKRFGRPFFEDLSRKSDADKQLFDEAMEQINVPETGAMLQACDFSGYRTIVDVGGGNGSVLAAILDRYPKVHGVLFDLPHVVERARARLGAKGIAARCEAVAGSFFESVPPDADCYLMRHILHDWTDDQCGTILANCRHAMPKHATLLIVEAVIQEGDESTFAKFRDLNMLAVPGGQERTASEFDALLSRSGLALVRIVPTGGITSVIEARHP